MKILLFNASPKNYGATQEILKIINSQLPPDISSELICLGDMNIAYCIGDKVCYDTCKCVLSDDMEMLIEKIDDADILVVAAPSYWADVPGQFKVFIDRCTVYSDTNPNPSHKTLKPGKKCYGIALRAGTRAAECEHIIETINHWCGHMKINMINSTYFCKIEDISDVTRLRDSICETAKEWFH